LISTPIVAALLASSCSGGGSTTVEVGALVEAQSGEFTRESAHECHAAAPPENVDEGQPIDVSLWIRSRKSWITVESSNLADPTLEVRESDGRVELPIEATEDADVVSETDVTAPGGGALSVRDGVARQALLAAAAGHDITFLVRQEGDRSDIAFAVAPTGDVVVIAPCVSLDEWYAFTDEMVRSGEVESPAELLAQLRDPRLTRSWGERYGEYVKAQVDAERGPD
jgi:hypothetical protein